MRKENIRLISMIIISADKGVFSLTWDESIDFDGQKVHYRVEISDTPEFTNIIYQTETDENNCIGFVDLKKGVYCYRVTAIDEDGNTRESFDVFGIEKKYYGVKTIVIQ